MLIALSGNSPGELWGWIRPLVFKLQKRLPNVPVNLYLFPCPYASGRETEVARMNFGIQRVFSPNDSIKVLAFGNGKHDARDGKRILIYLGGDLMYAALLGRRLRARTYAYQWGNRFWDRLFSGYFVSHERQRALLAKRGIPPQKIKVVGDLVVDAIHLESSQSTVLPGTLNGELLVTFFPGSRPVEITHMLPHFLRVAEIAKERMPKVQFAVALSPFATSEQISIALREKNLILESSFGTLEEERDQKTIRTFAGLRVPIEQGNQYSLMQQSDCIVTIPGTKSGEAGLLGRPMLVVLPTNSLDVIPYPGLLDFIGKIPLAGSALKRALGKKVLSTYKYLAQPNILSGESIVPELVENLTAARVAEAILDLLRNKERRDNMTARLRNLYRDCLPGADSLIDQILEESA